MKKIIKRTMIILITVMMMWMMMSWIDIVSDNTSNEPTHSQYNFFCMMFNRQYEMCGIVADTHTVIDDNGEAWCVDTTQYPVGTEVFITMIDKGTPQFKDDEIIDIREIERD